MGGSSLPGRRQPFLLLAVATALTTVAVTAWLLLSPLRQPLCRLEGNRAAAAPMLTDLTFGPMPGRHALVVTSLRSSGEAEQAGVRVGDQLEAVTHRRIDTIETLRRVVKASAGQMVSVQLRRGNEHYAIELDPSVQGCP
ncbi:hypothetical protein ACFB49_07160 [Sphingomonas sp. DBB INV C78]|uniref:PDZ domain-containing protein n=1 Tax=Sphingomonas sp. DBB INV C78 TaxID=3349434 RepID=UPI0036D42E94